MKKSFGVFALALLLLASEGGVWGRLPAAEAVKVKVEVDVDGVVEKKPFKKKAAPETFPVTLRNNLADRVFVALLYYDGNAKN